MKVTNYINGEFKEPSTGTFQVKISPIDRSKIAEVPRSGREDAREAIDSAFEALKTWANVPAIRRAEYLYKILEVFRQMKEEFMKTLMVEGGGTYRKVWGEVVFTERLIQNAAELARHYQGRLLQSDSESTISVVFKRSKGVVGVITPWNYPLSISMKKIAHALAVGNTVVYKPASDTPVIGWLIAQMVAKAGLPKGVFNLVIGPGPVVGEEIVTHKRISHVTFTGESSTGREIAAKAAGTLKTVTLELGGSDPLIILDDVDVDYAARLAVFASLFHQGQICTSAKRIIVHKAAANKFIERYVQYVKMLRIDDPRKDEKVDLGPLINERQVALMKEFVDDAVSKGGRMLAGGRSWGNFFEPTIFVDVDRNFRIMREEVFGPVRPIVVVENDDQAVEVANDTDYGLSGAVLTSNINRAFRIAEAVESGMFHINDVTFLEESHVPFGGIKASGVGREGGEWSFHETTYDRWVTVTLRTRRFPIPSALK